MSTIHQLIATHCTYGTSALERRKGEDADRVLGYSVRASSLEVGALTGWYRKIEGQLYYYLPRDAPAEAKRQLTAASAPKRLIYVPAVDDLEMLARFAIARRTRRDARDLTSRIALPGRRPPPTILGPSLIA